MKTLFIKSFIPDAAPLKISAGNGVYFFETSDAVYVLVNTRIAGIVTEKLKKTIDPKIQHINKPAKYVSLMKDRSALADADGDIAWSTYAWFSDAPAHYIHFDDKPSKNLRTNFV